MSSKRKRDLVFYANNETITKAVKLYQNDKRKAIIKYGNLNTWNTSGVTNMQFLFSTARDTGTEFDNINDIISDWDVSNVTDMGGMFDYCKTFNQPLDSWIVTNVTDMSYMFNGCETFNRPLNTWDTSNVTNMTNMFTNCKTFNQPLNTWDTSNVTDMSNMFSGCLRFNQNISEWVLMPDDDINISNMFENCPIDGANKPHIPVEVDAPVAVNAVQIHEASSKINYEKLNKFLRTKISQPIVIPRNYADYIKDTINTLIDNSVENSEQKEDLKVGLQKIYDDRLKGINYSERTSLVKDSIINSLEYVKTQPSVFKNMYVEAFVKDCVHAYEGNDGMTCAAGALERIIFSLVPACKTDPAIPDYITLIIIISGPELIKQSIKDWYILHNSTNSDNDIFHAKTKIEKQADLREYLLQRYPGLPDLIDDLIINYAEVFGWEASDFTYEGGKRRNSRKRRKRQKNKTKNKTRKRQKNKTRKTIHKRKNRT